MAVQKNVISRLIFLLFACPAATVFLTGCETYPGAKETATLSYEGVQKDATFPSRDAAEKVATMITQRISACKSGDKDVVISKATLVPDSQTGLIPMIITHWTLQLQVEYQIRESAKPGKRAVKVECLEATGTNIATAELWVNIRKSKAEANLINGVALFVFGWFLLGTGLTPYTLKIMGGEPGPASGCLNVVLIPAGVLILLRGLWMIVGALFF